MPSGTRPQPPTDTIRVAMGGLNGTLPWTTVFYLQVTTDGTRTAADLKSVTDATVNDFFTRFGAIPSSSVVIENSASTWITGVGTALEYVGAYSHTCTGGTEVANAATCIVVNWAINQYYRGGHPRMYLPGPVATGITNLNTLSSTTQSNVATAGNGWISDVGALTGTHILTTKLGTVSFARNNAWRSPPVFYAYQSAGCRAILGTQRRRLGGR